MLHRATSVPRLVGDRLVITEHSSGEPLETPRHLNSVVSRPQLYEQAVVLQVDLAFELLLATATTLAAPGPR